MILQSEIYNFHRLDLTRQAGFIVTVYDEDGLKLAATNSFKEGVLALFRARRVDDFSMRAVACAQPFPGKEFLEERPPQP